MRHPFIRGISGNGAMRFMVELLHKITTLLPFEWAQYAFMQNALLAVIIIAPLLALLGCIVITNQMTFFSDAIGHATLSGIALGAIAGMADPFWAMIFFAVLLTLTIELLRRYSSASSDTIIGLVMAFAVALGVVLLSRGGGFARYSKYLIGDILTITPPEIGRMLILVIGMIVVWLVLFNSIFLAGMNRSFAISRGQRVWLTETVFALLVALVVATTIPWIGLLVINSLLVLPAAAGRNMAHNLTGYVSWSVAIALASGIAGLIISYYLGTATGATIVLFAFACFVMTLFFRKR